MNSQLLTLAVLFAVVAGALGDKCMESLSCTECGNQVGCHWCQAVTQENDLAPQPMTPMGGCRATTTDCASVRVGTMQDMMTVEVEGEGKLVASCVSLDDLAAKSPALDMAAVCTDIPFPAEFTKYATCTACREHDAGPWCKLSVSPAGIERHGGFCTPKGFDDCNVMENEHMKIDGSVTKIEECAPKAKATTTSGAVPAALALSGSAVLALGVAVLAFSTQSLFC